MTTTLIIADDLTTQLSKIANNEQRSVEAVLRSALAHYEARPQNSASNRTALATNEMFDDEVSMAVHKKVSDYYLKKHSGLD